MEHIRPEFSRPTPIDHLDGDVVVMTVEAKPEERAALARRFSLNALDRLVATVRLSRQAGGKMIAVHGRLAADVVQTCVVSLEPVASVVEDEFSARFTTGPVKTAFTETPEGRAVDINPEEDEDEPEPVLDGVIDVGEIVAQHLSLALDPYPRAPGVTFEYQDETEAGQDNVNPFAVLERLRSRH